MIGESFHELTKEFKTHAIVLLETNSTSSFGAELNRLESIHVAGDPEVSVGCLLWLSELKLSLNRFEELFDSVWLTKVVAENHTALLNDMGHRLKTILIFACANEDEVLGQVHALELLEDELLLAIIQLLVL